MKTYITLATRYLMGRKLRTLLTTLAVVFGVAVLFGVNALIPSMLAAVESGVSAATGQADLSVSTVTGETFGMDKLSVVKNTSGIVAAAPSLQHPANLTGVPAAAQTVDLTGVDPTVAKSVRVYQMVSGRFLQSGDDQAAVISRSLADSSGLKVGSTAQLPTTKGVANLQVVGIVASLGGNQLLVPLSTAQSLLSEPGRINTIDVALAPAADRDKVKADLEKQFGSAYNVGSLAAASIAIGNSIQVGVVGGNIFAVLTLFMAGFLILNTFRAVIIERRHDIGMLRAIGATRRTIVGLILTESGLQGVIGTIIGLVLGYLLALAVTGALSGLTEEYLRVRISTIVITPAAWLISIGLGVGITLLAGIMPAISASRVPVLEALRPHATAPSAPRISRGTIAAIALLVLGTIGVLTGNSALSGLGAILFLVGLVWVSPALVRPIAQALQPLTRRLFKGEAQIAEGNMERQPGRSAVTASAVMIGLAIIIALSAVLSSLIDLTTGYLNQSMASDIMLLPPALALWGSDVGAGPELTQKIASIPGVQAASGLRYAGAQVQGQTIQVLGIDPNSYPKVSGLVFSQGDNSAYSALLSGRNAIASSIFAAALRLKVGDTAEVQTPEGVKPYRIVAVGSDYLSFKLNTLFVSQQNLATDFHKTEDIMVMANLAPGANRDSVQAQLQSVLKSYPQFTLNWTADVKDEQYRLFSQIFIGLYILLIVLAIPSLLGLVNTLAINVLERTREIGVLRAVGATQKQVRRMVLAEALLLGLAGAALGIAGGLALSYALTAMVAGVFGATVGYSFPWLGVLLSVIVALVMGVIASIVPARQAARLQIIQALQYE